MTLSSTSNSFNFFACKSLVSCHFIHQNVVAFEWYLLELLKAEADTYFIYFRAISLLSFTMISLHTPKLGEEAVVIPFASSEPMTSIIETHAGDDGDFYLRIFLYREELADRLHDVKTTFGKVVLAGVFPDHHVFVIDHHWQEDSFPLCHQLVYPLVGVRLVGQGIVEEEGVGCHHLRMFPKLRNSGKRQLPKLVLGELSLSIANLFSEFLLVHIAF